MNFLKGRIERAGAGHAFRAEGVDLPLPSAWDGTLAGVAGGDVTFGIRPEDLGSATAEGGANPPRLHGKVDVVEPMGSETYVYVTVGGETLVSRVDAYRAFRAGESVALAVAIDRAHLFGPDGATLV